MITRSVTAGKEGLGRGGTCGLVGGGNVNWCGWPGNDGRFLKTKQNSYHVIQLYCFWYTSAALKSMWYRDTRISRVYCGVIHSSQGVGSAN